MSLLTRKTALLLLYTCVVLSVRSAGSFQLPSRQRSTAPKAPKARSFVQLKASGGSEPTVPIGKIASAASFCALDVACRKGFQHYQIAFPSSLGCCGILLSLLLALPKSMSTSLLNLLQPGANLLAQWLPVFFVPSLVTLPLASGVASSNSELAKLALIIVGGFVTSLYTTSGAVVAIRKLLSKGETPQYSTPEDSSISKPAVSTQPKPKPFTDLTAYSLYLLALTSGASTFYASTVTSVLTQYQKALQSFFLLSSTLGTFVFGARLPFTKIVHPLVTCTTLTWALARGLGHLVGTPFTGMLQAYKVGSLIGGGAGDVLLFLLGPAVVSLAVSMYNRRQLVRDNWAAVLGGVFAATMGGLFGTAWAVQALGLGETLRLSLLSRNITSPLAMAITGICGGNVSLAVSMVVVTGLLGANFGATLLTAMGIKDPIARGLGMGAAAHGLGTASIVNEPQAFAFSAISMALTASAATVAVSVPGIRQALLQLALRGVA